MAIETDNTLDFFLNINDFGIEVTYTPDGGTSRTVTGIFDNPYLAADAGGIVEFNASSPTFMTRTSAITGASYGDELVIDSVTYVIREVMPDGTGMTTLALEEQ